METRIQQDDEVPLLQGLRVGIIYNLKSDGKEESDTTVDYEAEYDHIETVLSLKAAIEKTGAKAELLEAGKNLFRELEATPIDIAFNIAEGSSGRAREAEVPAILNLYGIPYTGSDGTTLCIALDKALTKRLLSTYHIATPGYAVISKENAMIPDNLHYPVIVKPNAEGSSKGVNEKSIVESKEELQEIASRNINLYHQEMLAEEYIEGREFTVGIIGNGEEMHVFHPMEIVYKRTTQGDYHVYSYSVKQEFRKYVSYECPSSLSSEAEQKMMDAAATVYRALECRDFARMDFRVSPKGEIFFIEINPLPGLEPGYSDFPMLAEFCGVGYDELIKRILTTAVRRCCEGGELHVEM